MPAIREVAFHLDRFEWAEDRLEVAGRWQGLAGRRLSRPVLTITIGERRKRIAALPGDHVNAEEWLAEFPYPADPDDITLAELEVGRSVVVELPLPDKRRRRRRRSATQDTGEVLRAEAGALRSQVQRLRAELAGREREIMQLKGELDALSTDERDALLAASTQEHAAIPALDNATVEIARVAAERDAALGEAERVAAELDAARRDADRAVAERDELSRPGGRVEAIVAERDAALAAAATERERRETEVGELREAFAEAAAEAEATRDRHRAENERAAEVLAQEQDEAARLRLELEQERTEAARLRGEIEDTQGGAARLRVELEDEQAEALRLARALEDEQAEALRLRRELEDEQAAALRMRRDLDEEEAEGIRLRRELGAARQEPSRLRPAPDDPQGPIGPATPIARRRAAAAPPTEPLGPLDEPAPEDEPRDDTAEAPGRPRPADGPGPTQLFDPPGPVHAERGPNAEEGGSLGPRAVAAVASVREWLEGFTNRTNGHVEAVKVHPAQRPRPHPQRNVAPARARASGAVQARRHPQELWGLRILAAVLVALLLLAFILLVSHFA